MEIIYKYLKKVYCVQYNGNYMYYVYENYI